VIALGRVGCTISHRTLLVHHVKRTLHALWRNTTHIQFLLSVLGEVQLAHVRWHAILHHHAVRTAWHIAYLSTRHRLSTTGLRGLPIELSIVESRSLGGRRSVAHGPGRLGSIAFLHIVVLHLVGHHLLHAAVHVSRSSGEARAHTYPFLFAMACFCMLFMPLACCMFWNCCGLPIMFVFIPIMLCWLKFRIFAWF
jgi:hypothetical protein